MIKRIVKRAVFVVLAALASTAAMAQTATVKTETVRIQKYPGVVSLLAVVAAEKGYCSKHGLDCVLVTNSSSVVGLQALLSGGLDVATPAVATALQLAAKGTPVRFIGNAWQKNPYEFAVDAQAAMPKDLSAMMRTLKGKRIGVTTRGSGPEYALRSFLQEAGMKEGDVTVVAVGAPDLAYAALVNKQIDAAISYPPMGALCEVMKTCNIYAMLSKGEWPKELDMLDGAQIPLVVRAELAEKKPHVVKALRSAFKEAEAFIQADGNLDALIAMVNKHNKFDNPKAAELTKVLVRNAIPAFFFDLDPKALQAASDYMLRTDQLDKPYDTSGLSVL